eukprot:1511984-Rhodomonas_salina.1
MLCVTFGTPGMAIGAELFFGVGMSTSSSDAARRMRRLCEGDPGVLPVLLKLSLLISGSNSFACERPSFWLSSLKGKGSGGSSGGSSSPASSVSCRPASDWATVVMLPSGYFQNRVVAPS